MKYLLGSFFLALVLTGCNSYPTHESPSLTLNANTTIETQVINFVGPMDLTIQLKSSDNFETAEMIDNSGKVHHLKQTVAASGVRLANDEGVSIHFKRGEGVVELVKGKPISITEFKK
ncbi:MULTISPECIES: MliC family protein [unclassified Acinetobacter]|uniref:MliC family protein n=1 Tax=unclassified Acinetobacter TaxID=196816 RepID=UPI001C237D7A|nr:MULTISPECIES: MliC family protein [unclassified Acinetobacter]